MLEVRVDGFGCKSDWRKKKGKKGIRKKCKKEKIKKDRIKGQDSKRKR